MKSIFAATVAAVALIATSESQRYYSVTYTTSTPEVQLKQDCSNVDYSGRGLAVTFHKNYLVFFPAGDTCAPTGANYSQITATDQIAKVSACWDTSTTTRFKAGADGFYCPIAFATACAVGQFCPTWRGGKLGTPCPETTKFCEYPAPTHLLVSDATFPTHFSDHQPPPNPVINHIRTVLPQYCPPYSLAASSNYSTNQGKTTIQAWPIRDPDTCTDEKIKEYLDLFWDVVNTWNATPGMAEDEKYPVVGGTYKKVAITPNELLCYNSRTNAWGCKSEGNGCDIACAEGLPCTTNADCGDKCGFSEELQHGVCVSSALTTFVAPVLAAVLAVAFF